MLVAAVLLLTMPQTAGSARDDAACPATQAPLPSGMDGWSRPVATSAGMSAAKATPLRVGEATTATLISEAALTYAAAPAKPAERPGQGGIFAFTISKQGRYRVSLGSAAWVDVVNGSTVLTSVGHGHGPTCSTVRKMVDFDLTPGRYTLQVAGSQLPALKLMVSKAS